MSVSDSEMPPGVEGIEVEVEGYDDRYLCLWAHDDAADWALEAVGLSRDAAVTATTVEYVLFVPAKHVTRSTPEEWWLSLLCPAGFECVVKSVDDNGACVLGLAPTVTSGR